LMLWGMSYQMMIDLASASGLSGPCRALYGVCTYKGNASFGTGWEGKIP
jgi:hypothetical protein